MTSPSTRFPREGGRIAGIEDEVVLFSVDTKKAKLLSSGDEYRIRKNDIIMLLECYLNGKNCYPSYSYAYPAECSAFGIRTYPLFLDAIDRGIRYNNICFTFIIDHKKALLQSAAYWNELGMIRSYPIVEQLLTASLTAAKKTLMVAIKNKIKGSHQTDHGLRKAVTELACADEKAITILLEEIVQSEYE